MIILCLDEQFMDRHIRYGGKRNVKRVLTLLICEEDLKSRVGESQNLEALVIGRIFLESVGYRKGDFEELLYYLGM